MTDAISAQGLQAGQHKIGQLDIEVKDDKAFIAGTSTLCGSIASMIQCVRNFIRSTGELEAWNWGENADEWIFRVLA